MEMEAEEEKVKGRRQENEVRVRQVEGKAKGCKEKMHCEGMKNRQRRRMAAERLEKQQEEKARGKEKITGGEED